MRCGHEIFPSSARRGMSHLIAIMALSASLAAGQIPLPGPSSHPDISGYWELRYDSFNVPAASLTTQAAAEQPIQRRHDVEAIRWCINVGVPALMGDRAPLDIRQSATVTAVVAKSPSSVRYIYTDGRHHPDKDDLEPTTSNAIVCWKAASGCPLRSRGKTQRYFRSPMPTSSDTTKFSELTSHASTTAIPAMRSVRSSY